LIVDIARFVWVDNILCVTAVESRNSLAVTEDSTPTQTACVELKLNDYITLHYITEQFFKVAYISLISPNENRKHTQDKTDFTQNYAKRENGTAH